tara:strand:- start:99 stop:722 length:624 start_codon:yes stop_codon:yes gene_type:complete
MIKKDYAINYKKGAMFGLDARIALAMFGALSVISGAALYSAIQDAKVTQMITQMQEVLKATEAYALDTGADLPYDNVSTTYRTKILDLVKNNAGVDNWQGPYLPFSETDVDVTSEDFIKVFGYNLYTGYYQKDVDSLGGWTDHIKPCETGKPCFAIAAFSLVESSLLEKIDQKIDNGDGSDVGTFRYYSPGASGWAWLIGFPKLNQP